MNEENAKKFVSNLIQVVGSLHIASWFIASTFRSVVSPLFIALTVDLRISINKCIGVDLTFSKCGLNQGRVCVRDQITITEWACVCVPEIGCRSYLHAIYDPGTNIGEWELPTGLTA